MTLRLASLLAGRFATGFSRSALTWFLGPVKTLNATAHSLRELSMSFDVIDPSPPLARFVDQTWADILNACTRCGKCVAVCPVVPFAPGLAQADPKQVVAGVLGFMRDNVPMPETSATWARQCNGCGDCIPACPEGVNPRKMIMPTCSRVSTVHNQTPHAFRKMARAICSSPRKVSRMASRSSTSPTFWCWHSAPSPAKTRWSRSEFSTTGAKWCARPIRCCRPTASTWTPKSWPRCCPKSSPRPSSVAVCAASRRSPEPKDPKVQWQ
ncbi:MAG: (Fe-S)-binding protein [Betaproteobacteria bacterium]|nr:(Fe-S)-binding protein [Betaproteobacteria bacterium]